MRITVVPDDKLILVDGRALIADFVSEADVNAIQWYDNHGEMEFKNGLPNKKITMDDYETIVRPYVDIFQAEFARLHTPPESTPEEIYQGLVGAIQDHLDAFARSRNYDGILSAASYAVSGNPKFQAEGQYAVNARDATWAKAYEVLDQVMAGARDIPAAPELLGELPVLTWPV